jgi:hypothetical protein
MRARAAMWMTSSRDNFIICLTNQADKIIPFVRMQRNATA